MSINEQMSWVLPLRIWGAVTIICIFATLAVADILEDQSFYV